MREYPTVIKKTYVITPKVTCTVTTPNGTIIATCPANKQTAFVAQSNKVIVSDDTALFSESFNRASLTAPEGGETTPFLPVGALSWAEIEQHFSRNAQPGTGSVPAATTAPSAVYISRVPWARWEIDEDNPDGHWVNNASEVNEDVFGVVRKLMDNAGLQHQCSTDTVEGVDDYNGKLWPFYWQHGNYVTDEHGVKHITAIKGIHDSFDPYTKNTSAFGPAFWFFCCLEHSKAPDGRWHTHDGTENGTPLFQLWGISSRPFNELDEGRRAELTSLGVTAADIHLWPECQVWDAAQGALVPRPYWCHSAYCGGAELQEDGSYMITSKRNLPLYNNLSHNKLNALYGNKPGFGGSAAVQGFGVLFDIVKNATKDSQSIHMGMSNNNCTAVLSTLSTAVPGYLFPIASQAHFEPGGTVWLWQQEADSMQTSYHRSASVQIGRIETIETRTLTLGDGTQAESLCLVIAPETVEPFLVRTGTSEDAAIKASEAIAATKELTDADVCACCYVTQGMALSGESDTVIGKHDGSRTSLTNGKHPYRVQGTEYMSGAWFCSADTVAIKGTGEVAVTIDGIESTPTARDFVILHAGAGVTRKSSGTLQQYLDAGYTPIGITPTVEGWILNVQMSSTGLVHPTAAGGTGSGSVHAYGDYLWTGISPATFLCGGYLIRGGHTGSVCLNLNVALGVGYGFISGRD